ncbi:MAG: polyprenyl synthetase family protein [Acidobacteriaceae bacterium]|nr:polyprenyl synthetase family protein [Acidobacteriaceae bacterium]
MLLDSGSQFAHQLSGYRMRTMEVLSRSVPDGHPYLYGIVRETLSRAGKGLRPALCLATCGAFGGELDDAVYSAAALEMLHNGFLVHDDVEDLSETRHGSPAVHIEHGIPLAVNAGDAMQALSMRLLRKNVSKLGAVLAWGICEEFDHLLLRSLEGQALELGWIRNNDLLLKTEDYIRMVLLKTGWYSFVHPCRIGALIARRGNIDPSPLNEFGFYLGLAFQIQDDVLNLAGGRTYGKETAGDIYEGKRTLMLMHLLENCTDFERSQIFAVLSKPRTRRIHREVMWMHELMLDRGSIEFAKSAAYEFLAAAHESFDIAYQSCPESEHKSFLRSLTDYVLLRDR